MIIPLRTDSPLRHRPYMNWALIAVNVAIFLLERVDPSIVPRYELSPDSPRLICFITYAFLHADLLHIGGNMLFLYIFGNNVNDKMGNLGYLAYYLAGGVAAGLLFVLGPGQARPVLGASGAIAAVTGAYLVLFPRSNVTVLFFVYIIGQYEIASIWFILFFFAYDIWANFAQSDGVAHMAHIGGTVFGFCICFVLLWVRLLPRDQYDVVALVQRWNRRRQYRELVTAGYDPFTYGPAVPKRPAPPDPNALRIAELRAQVADARADHDLDRAAQLYLELQSLAPGQAMNLQPQLDIANHLAASQQYAPAAVAYELFLQTYPKYVQLEQVELMLGLIYARYLARPGRARELLTHALMRLHEPKEIDLAKAELEQLPPASPPGVPSRQPGK
jgi:membrane associated rhomboid family serine protease